MTTEFAAPIGATVGSLGVFSAPAAPRMEGQNGSGQRTTSRTASACAVRRDPNHQRQRLDETGLETVLELAAPCGARNSRPETAKAASGATPGGLRYGSVLESRRGPLGGPLRVRAPILRRAGGDLESSSERGGKHAVTMQATTEDRETRTGKVARALPFIPVDARDLHGRLKDGQARERLFVRHGFSGCEIHRARSAGLGRA